MKYIHKSIVILAIAALLGNLIVSCSPKESSAPSGSARPPESEAPLAPPAAAPPAQQPASLPTSKRSQSQDPSPQKPDARQDSNGETYARIDDNPFQTVKNSPLSTFSIDVDTASYSNIRRFINSGQLPPKDAVRLEEMINYFTYDYPQPKDYTPFSVTTEISEAPWNPSHKLVQIGLQAKRISIENLPSSNLVFLLDVSGSMDEPNKLPLLKSALRLLVNELGSKDRVSIVVYAGSAGVVLPPTPANQKEQILNALEKLQAGGSTAGGEGIQLAYKIAKENFIPSGNNRIIIATDGDFNVGISSDTALVRLIEQKRNEGILLTLLGFGMGNLQDAKMEQLADKGNGNYAYIDNILEANKVLVKQIGGTLVTVAKDVKIQVEFNPAKVQGYRLVGYENRILQNQDFNDDKKDAGEIGAGHSVTALYEVIPAGVKSDVSLGKVDYLKYQENTVASNAYQNNELMQIKLRYKLPNQTNSQLLTTPVLDKGLKLKDASTNFRFASAVAAFGMVLRDSEYKGKASFDEILKLANESKDVDLDGYRAEFMRLVQKSKTLKRL
ncbi:vWA domain-containing protein [Argonema galeatum]|uniref:vWA domain-containing protein n=1 Tax=Argonema galeatum TaxID=2942762 RepID=UPI0020128E4A|nr:VWA domain-containing protein [Argonema galeatum]MCL1464660.1 VWA domain-containing protein [Argonema galeatum A003/A1]